MVRRKQRRRCPIFSAAGPEALGGRFPPGGCPQTALHKPIHRGAGVARLSLGGSPEQPNRGRAESSGVPCGPSMQAVLQHQQTAGPFEVSAVDSSCGLGREWKCGARSGGGRATVSPDIVCRACRRDRCAALCQGSRRTSSLPSVRFSWAASDRSRKCRWIQWSSFDQGLCRAASQRHGVLFGRCSTGGAGIT